MTTSQLDACLLQISQILEREFNWLLANGTDREVVDEVRYVFFLQFMVLIHLWIVTVNYFLNRKKVDIYLK